MLAEKMNVLMTLPREYSEELVHPRIYSESHIVRVARIVSKDNTGAALYSAVQAAIESSNNPLDATVVWLGRHVSENNRMVIILFTLWRDGNHLRERMAKGGIDKPWGFDQYADLVEHYTIEHFEHPSDF